jgi:hypothetical protein
MTGSPFSWESRGISDKASFLGSEHYLKYYDAKYIGGLPDHPTPKSCMVYIYDNMLELNWSKGQEESLIIPYQSITSIENADEDKISKLRVLGLGLLFPPLAIAGLFWKQKSIYTVIYFQSANEKRTIVLDFGKYRTVEEAQSFIYKKMIEFKKTN